MNRITLHNRIGFVFFKALIVRTIMLMVILLVAGGMEKGFISADTYYDDFRYELGGAVYADTAKQVVDVDAFVEAYASVGDNVGYNFLNNPLDATPLWFWVVAITMYITKTYVSIRIINITISSLAVVYVYKFSKILYGEEVANKASNLLTFLPYPVIFSCFAYKDSLIMFFTFSLLYYAVKYKKEKKISLFELIKTLIGFTCLLFTRGGLTALLLLVCILIAFGDEIRIRMNSKTIYLGLIIAMVGIAVFLRSYYSIFYKLQYYLDRHSETLGGTSISYITINSIFDIYKLPFTYLFSVVMPIQLLGPIESWYSIVANINVIMTPIAIGATAYIFTKKNNQLVYWSCLLYYVICIITSINIFRHYYSLMPFSLIAFANYISDGNRINRRIIVYGGGMLFSIMLIVYYAIK